jgi:calcineurin-like phosphoesterase family protein
MDETLIQAWNAVVEPGDTVLHLGDLCHHVSYLKRLQGRIILVTGNHDKKKAIQGLVFAMKPVAYLDAGTNLVVCRHNPARFLPSEIATASLLLHGHSHGTRPSRSKYRDVGVDALNDLTPQHAETMCDATYLDQLYCHDSEAGRSVSTVAHEDSRSQQT